jgi:hypothetical protein
MKVAAKNSRTAAKYQLEGPTPSFALPLKVDSPSCGPEWSPYSLAGLGTLIHATLQSLAHCDVWISRGVRVPSSPLPVSSTPGASPARVNIHVETDLLHLERRPLPNPICESNGSSERGIPVRVGESTQRSARTVARLSGQNEKCDRRNRRPSTADRSDRAEEGTRWKWERSVRSEAAPAVKEVS